MDSVGASETPTFVYKSNIGSIYKTFFQRHKNFFFNIFVILIFFEYFYDSGEKVLVNSTAHCFKHLWRCKNVLAL
jgi:hypothetical protein